TITTYLAGPSSMVMAIPFAISAKEQKSINQLRKSISTRDRYRPYFIALSALWLLVVAGIASFMVVLIVRLGNGRWAIPGIGLGFVIGVMMGLKRAFLIHQSLIYFLCTCFPRRNDRLLLRCYDALLELNLIEAAYER